MDSMPSRRITRCRVVISLNPMIHFGFLRSDEKSTRGSSRTDPYPPRPGQNRLDRRVVDHALEIFGTLPVRGCEVGLFAAVPELSEFRMEPPGLEPRTDLGRVDLLGEFSGRGDDPHGVAVVEIGRADEACCVLFWAAVPNGRRHSSNGIRCFMLFGGVCVRGTSGRGREMRAKLTAAAARAKPPAVISAAWVLFCGRR